MGVVHKLSNEVIQFIIDQKKTNDNISCRRLVNIVSETFKINISKSSINTVLKNANLSSSVGRRASDYQKKKFFIPPTKKEQISKNMSAYGVVKKDVEAERENSSVKPQENREAFVESSSPSEKQAPIYRLSPQEMEYISVKRARLHQLKKETKENLGLILLKAAMYDLSQKSFIGSFLRKFVRKELNSNFDNICDALVFLNLLGIRDPEKMEEFKNHALWDINDLSGYENKASLFEWLYDFSLPPSASFEYEYEKQQILLNASAYVLELDDGTEIIVDISMESLWKKMEEISAADPIEKAIFNVSKYFISNNQTAVFKIAPGEERFSKLVYELISGFELYDDNAIKKISIVDDKKNVLVDFSTIPKMKRRFCFGVGPKNKEFYEFTKMAQWTKREALFLEEIEMVLSYAETKTSFFKKLLPHLSKDFRVFTVWRDESDTPFLAIVTNNDEISAQELLYSYFMMWPSAGNDNSSVKLSKHIDDFSVGAQNLECNQKVFDNLWQLLEDYSHLLHMYCCKKFFPRKWAEKSITDCVANIYKKSGYVYKTSQAHVVKLCISNEEKTQLADFEYVCQKVNENHTFLPKNQKIILSLNL